MPGETRCCSAGPLAAGSSNASRSLFMGQRASRGSARCCCRPRSASRFGKDEVLLGTIGAAFLEQRVLLLDFVANRVAILGAGEELPAALAAHVEFTPIGYRDHKIFVGVAVKGSTRRDLAFDTGSSTAARITTRDRWLEWTGRRPEDPSNTVMVAWAWDRYGKWLGAPIQGALFGVGGACLASPTAFFESTGLPNCDFDHYPFRISGLIGNALFEGRFSVIVDLPHRRFGLFAGSLAQAISR